MLTTCNKYEDGPFISLRSAKKRVIGEYELEKYFVDGADSSSVIQSLINDYGYTYHFGDYFDRNTSIATYCNNNDSCKRFFGSWYFIDSAKKMRIYGNPGASGWTFPFQTYEKKEWQILRLKRKEMWIAADIDGKNYELRFNKIKLCSKNHIIYSNILKLPPCLITT